MSEPENCTHNCETCGENCASRKQDPADFLEKPHQLSNIGKVIGVVSGKGCLLYTSVPADIHLGSEGGMGLPNPYRTVDAAAGAGVHLDEAALHAPGTDGFEHLLAAVSYTHLQPGDVLCVVSDGVIYAGVGETLNFGWTRENVAAWMAKTAVHEKSAPRLALSLSQTIDDLYLQKPGDDSTVMIASVTDDRVVNLLSGPPKSKEDDGRMLGDFMRSPGAKVVCGGSSANMVGRILGRKVNTTLEYDDPMIPPTATIEGIDLVTEGVLTMSRTVEILREYVDSSPDAYYFKKLDAPNGAAELAKVILEDCTCLRLFVGTAINPAHQNPNLPSDLSIKGKLIDEIASLAKRLGKSVEKYTY